MTNKKQSNWMNGYKYWARGAKSLWARHGGRICTIAGTTGLFLTGAHACRTTYKHHDELVENGKRISEAYERRDGEKAYKRYLRGTGAALKYGLKTSKHYLPDIIGGALSAYTTTKGWGIEHNHYEQAATMVGVLTADFMNYRKNVIAEHGEEADRRYRTTKHVDGKSTDITLPDGTKVISNSDEPGDGKGYSIQLDQNALRIWYSKETTPMVWSPSHVLRMDHLNNITNQLDIDLVYGGSISVNDVRRHFYGKKGDVPCGGIFGRIWDPANPEHPERGRRVNLHYEEDEDFMSGLTDSCWIFIDIDDEPLSETMSHKNNISEVEDTW